MIEFSDFKHGRAKVNGAVIHYRSAGAGEPVLLLHGWPQHSLQWHSVAPALAEHYQVITPDLPGCGGSSFSLNGYDKRNVAAQIGELVDQIGLGPVRIGGYDHGAGVAYAYACARRDAVKKLALMEYVLPGCGYERALQPTPEWNTGSNWQLALFTVPDVAEFAFRGRERELLTWFLWHGSHNPAPVSAAHLTEYVDQISKPGALRAGIEYYAAVWKDLEHNKETMQSKLTIPVMGIGGQANIGPFAAKTLEAVAEQVSGAVIADAGHWLCDENPAALSRTLLDFFAG